MNDRAKEETTGQLKEYVVKEFAVSFETKKLL